MNTMTVNYATSRELFGEKDNDTLLELISSGVIHGGLTLELERLIDKRRFMTSLYPDMILTCFDGVYLSNDNIQMIMDTFKRIQVKAANLGDQTYIMLTQ